MCMMYPMEKEYPILTRVFNLTALFLMFDDVEGFALE